MVLEFILMDVLDYVYICFGTLAVLVLLGCYIVYRVANKLLEDWNDE